jgi:5-methylcytosine-specific restriction endonuclease McrA
MRADARYCSPECNSHAHHQTRKASARIGARQERIDRASIIERDGSCCHICGELVPEALITIDHIVPLAENG